MTGYSVNTSLFFLNVRDLINLPLRKFDFSSYSYDPRNRSYYDQETMDSPADNYKLYPPFIDREIYVVSRSNSNSTWVLFELTMHPKLAQLPDCLKQIIAYDLWPGEGDSNITQEIG